MRNLLILLIFTVCVVTCVFAQATPIEPEGLSWGIIIMILGVVGGILEIVLRLKPTDKDYTIINFILRVINAVVPNKAKSGIDGRDKAIFKIRKVLKKK